MTIRHANKEMMQQVWLGVRMALTKVIGNGLGTLGDGTANDTKIVFDGNAQDYHVGLDDSTDSLTIGLGSTLGTTSI